MKLQESLENVKRALGKLKRYSLSIQFKLHVLSFSKASSAQVQYKQKIVPVYWRNDSLFLRKLYLK